jgi:hypothetical protein
MPDPVDARESERTCPWCSARAAAADDHCHSCGAALAQRESIGGLVIPGVTAVDPALAAFDAQPRHLRGPSPSQGIASGVIVAAAGGPQFAIAALGGLAAVAAAEYLGARNSDGTGPVDLESVGKPSGATLMALERIEREGETPPAAREASGASVVGTDGAITDSDNAG